MNTSDIINIALCILSFLLAAVSVVTVVITLRQNSKMLESSTRPYVTIYGQVANFQNPTFYLVLKNYGSSGAVIKSLTCDTDLALLSFNEKRVPFSSLAGSYIAPQQSLVCNLDTHKLRDSSIKAFCFDIEYSSETKNYKEHCPVNFEAFTKNVQARASTSGSELKIISYTLQDMVEKQL